MESRLRGWVIIHLRKDYLSARLKLRKQRAIRKARAAANWASLKNCMVKRRRCNWFRSMNPPRSSWSNLRTHRPANAWSLARKEWLMRWGLPTFKVTKQRLCPGLPSNERLGRLKRLYSRARCGRLKVRWRKLRTCSASNITKAWFR